MPFRPKALPDTPFVEVSAEYGSPEGVHAGSMGAIYRDVENGVLYVKRSGTATTGWNEVAAGVAFTHIDAGTMLGRALDAGSAGDVSALTPTQVNAIVGSVDLTRSQTGATGAVIAVQGESTTNLLARRYGSANTHRPQVLMQRGRGTVAAPTAVQQNNEIGRVLWQAWDGVSDFQNAADITVTITEPTPGAAAMGSKLTISLAALGSATPTEALEIDHANGLSVGGVQVLDQSQTILHSQFFG